MIVGITQRITSEEAYYEERDALSHDWIAYFKKMGYTPLIIPNDIDTCKNLVKAIKPSAIILSNGNDVNLKNQKEDILTLKRDGVESFLFDYSKKEKIPCLGVCRGFQFICNRLGLTIKKLDPPHDHVTKSHVIQTHLNKMLNVNSYHNFVVNNENISSDIQVIATSDDGKYIEACSVGSHFLGLQWHPERENQDQVITDSLILKFLSGKGIEI